TGTLNGVSWVGTPLANVSAFAANVQRGIDVLLTQGGTVSLSSDRGNAGEIILRQGSTINVGGGYVRYEDGIVNTSKLIAADGHIVDIAHADSPQTYVGVAGVDVLEHPHWGNTTTETFVSPILSGGTPEPGYVEGHNAGGIILDASAYAVEG